VPVMDLTLVLGVVDSALAGYQEQVVTNLGMCIANVISTAALVIPCTCHHSDSRAGDVCAVWRSNFKSPRESDCVAGKALPSPARIHKNEPPRPVSTCNPEGI